MNIKTIVDKYLNAKDLKRYGGNDFDLSPILPQIMIDCAYQLFHKYVEPQPCEHKVQQYKTKWLDAYQLFRKDLTSVLNTDEKVYVCDLMDDYWAYIEHDADVVKWQINALLMSVPSDKREIISVCMLINILCQSADKYWKHVYEGVYRGQRSNREIQACEKWVSKWKDSWYKLEENIDPNKSKEVTLAVDILCTKLINFMKKYIKENAES